MPRQPRTFSVVDPRTMDGNPYDVAERAAKQAAGIAALLAQTIEEAELMIRNAELSRQLVFEQDPDPEAWANGPQAAKLKEAFASAEAIHRSLAALARAAGYDPLHPPKD